MFDVKLTFKQMLELLELTGGGVNADLHETVAHQLALRCDEAPLYLQLISLPEITDKIRAIQLIRGIYIDDDDDSKISLSSARNIVEDGMAGRSHIVRGSHAAVKYAAAELTALGGLVKVFDK